MNSAFSFVSVLYIFFTSCTQHGTCKNVLMLVADDAGFEMGLYGNPVCHTPNLDKLGKMGVVFDSAHTVVSSCSPSRATILTGLPPHQQGMYGLHQEEHHFQSFDKVMSISRVLRKNNITTGIIGKKHVGPEKVYPFDFSETEENNSILQVGRNITNMKLLVRTFLTQVLEMKSQFFLYVGFHDPHRCGHTHPEYGAFCEHFGDGSSPEMGYIQDWHPRHYSPDDVLVPYFIPDTPVARRDLAAQYTTISRLDQGIGLIMKELSDAKLADDTLVIYTSDNGIPFPSGRTNLYEAGIKEPLIIYSPQHIRNYERFNELHRSQFVSHVDILPTVLDWFHIDLPRYTIFNKHNKDVQYTGQSLLHLLHEDVSGTMPRRNIFTSHSLHEVTMYYPMRSVKTNRYKLIHNLNYLMPFPIDEDFYMSPTFQDILLRTEREEDTNWYKTLQEYYFRGEYELYDLAIDPWETSNLVKYPSYKLIVEDLLKDLRNWQNITSDPWICSPHNVLENKGAYKYKPSCLPLYNNKN